MKINYKYVVCGLLLAWVAKSFAESPKPASTTTQATLRATTPAPSPASLRKSDDAKADHRKLSEMVNKYKIEASKKKKDFNALQLKASELISEVGKKPLDQESAELFVQIIKMDIPVDAGQALLANTVDVIKANRQELDKAIKKLSPKDAEAIETAIFVAISEETTPPD